MKESAAMMLDILKLRCLLCLVVTACGPRVEDEHGGDDVEPDVAEQGCEESSCPIACADRTCIGSLGIGRCVDDKCSPTPIECVVESSPEDNCTEVCASRGLLCEENGCEGATAFGYPGTELEAISVCGESSPDVKAAVERIEGPCDAPLVFSGEGSFSLYQCCCDHPDY